MMRDRATLKKHVEDIYKLPDDKVRGFKLFVVEIELLLDCRDYLAEIAEDARRRNIEAKGKLPPTEKKA